MRFHRLILYILVLLAVAAAARAVEEEPAARFEDRLEVGEVLLDVLVTDRKGQAVAGLQAEDFVVKEGAEILEVTAASFYSTRYGEATDERGASAPQSAPASRYFLFFLHDQRLLVV